MYFFFTDETNTSPNNDPSVKFFVYGGLIIPGENLSKLHEGVDRIRKFAKFNPEDDFKFNTWSRPPHVDLVAFNNAKNAVLELAIEAGCQFIVCVVYHELARTQSQTNLVYFSANTVISKFNKFLNEKDSSGIVLLDRLPNGIEYDYMIEKFTKGLTFTNRPTIPLEKILLFASSCNNASHANTVADIVIGSFRYCINNPSNITIAKRIMQNLLKLFLARRIGKDVYAKGEGLLFSPHKMLPKYRKEYDALLLHINSLLN